MLHDTMTPMLASNRQDIVELEAGACLGAQFRDNKSANSIRARYHHFGLNTFIMFDGAGLLEVNHNCAKRQSELPVCSSRFAMLLVPVSPIVSLR